MKIKTIAIALMIAASSIFFTGCRSVDRVNHNLSKQADEFNVYRKLTVINARTDTVMLEISGYMAITNDDDHELVATIRTGDKTYYKDYVYLNDWTCYIVEQTEPSNTSRWFYEVIVYPE